MSLKSLKRSKEYFLKFLCFKIRMIFWKFFQDSENVYQLKSLLVSSVRKFALKNLSQTVTTFFKLKKYPVQNICCFGIIFLIVDSFLTWKEIFLHGGSENFSVKYLCLKTNVSNKEIIS